MNGQVKTKEFIFIQAPSYRKPVSDSHISKAEDPLAMPFGGLFLCESLLRKNISACILLGEIEEIKAQIVHHVDGSTKAFGISSFSGDMLKSAIEIARYLRIHYPHIPIIWGGVHVTAVREQSLMHELVDFIVWGEGEQSLPQLLEVISNGGKPEDLKKVKGIGYKVDGKAFITLAADTEPLDRVFVLPYHLINLERIKRKMKIGAERFFMTTTARGCPFACKFCSNSSVFNPYSKLRMHTMEYVLKNISVLVDEYGADAIGFEDEITIVNKSRLLELCKALKSLGKNIKYRLQTRVDILERIDDDALRLMRDIGFVAVSYGVESGSQRVLDFIGKRITIQQILNAHKRLKKFGFYQTYTFMFCIPTETIEEMKMSVRLFVKLARASKYCPFPFRRMEPYIPLPDTELFSVSVKHGFIPPVTMEGWTEFDARYLIDRRERVRPWLSVETVNFAQKIMDEGSEIADLFVGSEADHDLIDKRLDELEKFVM